jgi:diguanylate cyclase (GGDEF)-like protein
MCEAGSNPYEDCVQLNSESVPGGFVRYFADGDEEIIHANQYVIELFECASAEEFLELTQGSFRHFVCEDDSGAVENSIIEQVRNRKNLDHVYYRIRTKTGRLVTVVDYGRLVRDSDYGRPIFEVFVARVSRESTVDWLTGLSSMARFHELARMGASMLAGLGQRIVAIAFDIMGMKSFNTRFGREEGDRLLCALANALRIQFGGETCSRFGEDRFYAFAPEKDIERKVKALFADFATSDFKHVPPVRVGLYLCDEQDDIVAVGFDRARTACDLDRTTWQSHFAWFTDEMRADAQLRIHVLESLDQAIAKGWIRPYYQPVVRSSTGKICEEEALARWVDPEYGVLAPDKFIPVLEESSLLHRMDLHVISCVLADFKKKLDQGIPIVPVSVNVSYRDLTQINVAHEISTRADALGVPHDLLHVEFTESAIHSNPELFLSQVHDLHEAGFEVWMDDFGSGYSSLNVLQRYEFDVVKLDMEFMRVAEKDIKKSRLIVAGIVRTAKRLGVRALAEGVETQEQAAFLEGIGCDMLQGYLFSRPLPLDEVAQRLRGPNSLDRESREEEAYWNDVSRVSLTDFSEFDDQQGIEGISISKFPAGVLENRQGTWYVVRDNRSMGEFLERVGILDQGHIGLRVNEVQRDLGAEFNAACGRSVASGTWEHIAGRLEYGSGFQFYVKPLSSVDEASAYLVVGVPTMLGTALGSYGDVPVGYAVFRVVFNEAKDEVVDAEYVYANDLYRSWAGYGDMELTGKSFLEVAPNASTLWFPYCYRAAVLGEEVHDTVYSPEAGHWMTFHLAPSPVEGCCVYAFSIADDEHYERERMQVGLDTSDLIIRVANALNGELSYDVAMNRLLEAMSEVIHPERLYVFECGETTVSNTFEWCAEGVEPQIDTLQDLDYSEFDTWERLLAKYPVVVIPDVEEFKESDPRMYWQLSRQGITHVLAVPFYDGDRLLGYLGADNYMLEEDVDSIRVLQTVASFVSARIVNRRLLDTVEQHATRDELTGLLNRRGVDHAIAERLSASEGEPYSLALMDIDGLKVTNNTHGRELGDIALRRIARELERVFPEGSVVGRNGGDEFIAALFGDNAQRMETCLAELTDEDIACEYEGESHVFSLSGGYVVFPEQADDLHSVYTKADAALHALRHSDRHGFVRYAPGMDDGRE